jgi:hypothetical protein
VTTARKTDPIRKIPTKNGRPGTASSSTWASGETACDQRCHTFSKLGKARAARVKIIADRGRGVLVKPTRSWWLRPSRPGWTDAGTSGRALSEALRTASDSCRTGSATFSFQAPTKTPGQTGDRTPGQWLQNCNVLSGRSVKTLGRILASPVPFALLTGSDQYARKGIAGYFMTSVVS